MSVIIVGLAFAPIIGWPKLAGESLHENGPCAWQHACVVAAGRLLLERGLPTYHKPALLAHKLLRARHFRSQP